MVLKNWLVLLDFLHLRTKFVENQWKDTRNFKCPYRQNVYFPSDPIFHVVNFDLDEKRFFIKFKKPENPVLLPSIRAADLIIDMLKVVT